jgi:hypothetical protein
MDLRIASLFLILFAVIIIVWGIAIVHTLPGKIATKRNHSQTKAIEVMSLLGLLLFPLWMGALIWAYMEPVRMKATVEGTGGEGEDTQKEIPATLQIGNEEMQAKET